MFTAACSLLNLLVSRNKGDGLPTLYQFMLQNIPLIIIWAVEMGTSSNSIQYKSYKRSRGE